MCQQGDRIKIFPHTLANVLGEHFQSFQKFFPASLNFV